MSALILALRLCQPASPPPPPSLYAEASKPNPSSFHRRPKLQHPKLLQYPSLRAHIFPKSVGGKCFVPLASSATTSGDSDGTARFSIDDIQELFDRFPQPVKNFPWMRALQSFQNIILEILWTVVKYLCVPLLAVTSLSEMSYCAHERRMGVIPISFIIGFTLVEVLRDAAEKYSLDLKEGGIPWHLFLIASFLTLLKLLGPYYPYWGRLLIPHFANGGLWRTLWLIVTWYRKPHPAKQSSRGPKSFL